MHVDDFLGLTNPIVVRALGLRVFKEVSGKLLDFFGLVFDNLNVLCWVFLFGFVSFVLGAGVVVGSLVVERFPKRE